MALKGQAQSVVDMVMVGQYTHLYKKKKIIMLFKMQQFAKHRKNKSYLLLISILLFFVKQVFLLKMSFIKLQRDFL